MRTFCSTSKLEVQAGSHITRQKPFFMSRYGVHIYRDATASYEGDRCVTRDHDNNELYWSAANIDL
jgi:hypothetical protein